MPILCPHCQSPAENVSNSTAGEIVCPSCGSSFPITRDCSTVDHPRPPRRMLGRFELLDTVGQGAFGTVYRARDAKLDRVVALKTPRAGHETNRAARERFLREARVAAQLRHPNIVAVHEVGVLDETLFLVSDFVEGVSLDDYLSGRRPTFRQAAQWLLAVTEALAYAHKQGVVHRDVKPSNIMIDGEGRPLLMDFGLARRDGGEATMTVEGQVLGTPAYMSPEQARGDAHKVDGRSDVYSLGAVLYQMLTGRLPFRGNKRMLLHQVLHDEPAPPRRLNAKVPRDLETICLKAMAKEPAGRYASAKALAGDLRRWLEGKPIQARPVGVWERGWRWCWRNPVVAALSAAVAVVLLAGSAVALFFANQADTKAQEVAQEQKKVKEVGGRAEELKKEKEIAQKKTAEGEKTTKKAENDREKAEKERDTANLKKDAAQYAIYLRAGQLELDKGNIAHALEILQQCPADLRGWEHGFLTRQCEEQRPWEIPWNGPGILSLALSPDGRRLVGALSDGSIGLWDLDRKAALQTLPAPKNTPQILSLLRLLFSPDSGHVAVFSPTLLPVPQGLGPEHQEQPNVIRVVELATGKDLALLKHPAHGFMTAAYDRKGTRLLTAARVLEPQGKGQEKPRSVVQVWDVRSDKQPDPLVMKDRLVWEVAFDPEGKRFVTLEVDNSNFLTEPGAKWTMRLWTTARQFVRSFEHVPPMASGLHFTPDGKVLLAGSEGRVKRWEVATGKPLPERPLAGASWFNYQFTPDGRYCLTASLTGGGGDDNQPSEFALWDVASGRPLSSRKGTGQHWHTLSADGRRVVAFRGPTHIPGPGTIQVWELARETRPHFWEAKDQQVTGLGLSPDGGTLAVSTRLSELPPVGVPGASSSGYLRLWSLESGELKARVRGTASAPYTPVMHPRLPRLAAGSEGGAVYLRDHAGKLLHTVRSADAGASAVAGFDGDGGRLLSIHSDLGLNIILNPAEPPPPPPPGVVTVWDLATAQAVVTFRKHTGTVTGAAFSGDGRHVLSCGGVREVTGLAQITWGKGELRCWDAATGVEVWAVTGEKDGVHGARVSPDGKWVIANCGKGVKLWEAATGKEVHRFDGPGPAMHAIFSPDNRRVVSSHLLAQVRGEVILWDLTTKQQLLVLPTPEITQHLQFTRDGRRLVSSHALRGLDQPVGFGSAVRFWDAADLGRAQAQADPPEPSWKGKTVIVKDERAPIHLMKTEKGKPSLFIPQGNTLHYSYEATEDEGGWVGVRQKGLPRWVSKAHLILLEDAVEYATEHIAAAPKNAAHYRMRGWAWYLLGQLDQAEKDYDMLIGLEPKEMNNYYNRAFIHRAKKDYAAALKDWEHCTQLSPKEPLPFNNIAWLRATCPAGEFRDGKKAVAAATVAMKLTGNKEGFYMDTLAAAHAEAGNFPQAVHWQQLALRDPVYNAEYASEGQERLLLFRSNRPYRQAEK